MYEKLQCGTMYEKLQCGITGLKNLGICKYEQNQITIE